MIEVLITLLTLLPFLGLWATWKLYKWYRFYGGRFLGGLLLASLGTDVATVPIAFAALYRLAAGPDAPTIRGTGEMIAISLLMMESVFVYLVLMWKDLDRDMKRVRKGNEDVSERTNLPPKENR